MSKSILEFEPKALWKHFGEICKIYRESGHENAIRDFLISFADRLGLSHKSDAKGNLVIKKGAANSKSEKTIILQAHIDMVCVKGEGSGHDFTKDPIVPVIEDGWVTAKSETTLGADDGISIAAYMSIMEAGDIVHGPLEFLFTVEEETGLHGATALDPSLITGDLMINTDSEEEGCLTIGCAGEETLSVSHPILREQVHKSFSGIKVHIGGLLGGHSGLEIIKQRANAIKLMARIFAKLDAKFDVRLSDFEGGVRRNAIPDRATMHLAVKEHDRQAVIDTISGCAGQIKNEYSVSDPGFKIEFGECAIQDVIAHEYGRVAMGFVNSIYNGVVRMSDTVPGLVETSTNVGVIKCKDGRLEMQISTRSSVDSEKKAANGSIRSIASLAGIEPAVLGGYPGWKPDVNSKLLSLTKKTYFDLFGKEPRVIAVHAGLECGIVGEKRAGMEMISYGPEIHGAHSTSEKVEIKSVEKFYKLTLELLRRLAA
jgi:dipeptidase D